MFIKNIINYHKKVQTSNSFNTILKVVILFLGIFFQFLKVATNGTLH